MHASVSLLAQTGTDIELEEVVGRGLTLGDWLLAGGVLLGSALLALLVGRLVYTWVSRDDGDTPLAVAARRLARFLIVAAGLIYALVVLEVQIAPLLGALGILALALAFAAQPVLENAFASAALRRRKHFGRGDQISIHDGSEGGTEGTVVEVNLRNVVLRNFDGERVTVPCGTAVKSTVVNHTIQATRRTELRVGVHYRTDLPRAQQVFREALESVGDLHEHPEPEVWVVEFATSSIDFVLRYWTAPDINTVYRVRSEVAMAVKAGLDSAGIEIPFPQRVVTMAERRSG